MGHTACAEPQCLYKGALYLLPFPSVALEIGFVEGNVVVT